MSIEYKPYNNFIEYLDYVDVNISNTSRLYLILAKLFGKLSHVNLRFVIFNKLYVANYPEDCITRLPKFAFRINDIYYSPYLITGVGLSPVSFYSPKLNNFNFTYMKSIYQDLIKYFEFYSTSEFNYRGTFEFTYEMKNGYLEFTRKHINFIHSPITETKRTYDKLLREFFNLAFKYDTDDIDYNYTFDDVKKDMLETIQEKMKERKKYLKEDEFSIDNYDGSFIELYVIAKYSLPD